MAVYDQAEYAVRCEWGQDGVAQLAPISGIVIVIDVLSFSTCVDIVVGRGGVVFPFDGSGEEAAALAANENAVVAGRRGSAAAYSLSPAALIAAPAPLRLVLPSPNGSRLSVATGRTLTVAGCLRNARAVGDFARRVAEQTGAGIALIPAGERWWPEDRLRPSLEDWLGAGAIASYLGGPLSPEAEGAVAAFRAVADRLPDRLIGCSSGKELVAAGYEQDVMLAAELNASTTVPAVSDRAYQAAPSTG